MANAGNETTPLLASEEHPHTALFDKLDRHCIPDDIHDHPPTPKVRQMKKQLTHATLPAGHGHPMHHHMQSPALLLRIEQAIEHGFSNVVNAIRAFFKTKARTPHLDDSTPSTYTVVAAVFGTAVLTMLTMTAVSPTLLLYMNYVGFTNATNISAYVLASAFSSAVPIASNIILGYFSSRFGPGRALSFGAAASAIGLCIVIFSRHSVALFFIGYALYCACNSLRVIRVSILTKVVPEEERTTVLATHALMTPIGALMGPLFWIGFQLYRGSVPLLGGAVHFDRFSITYVLSCVVLLVIALVSMVMLNRITPVDGSDNGNGNGADMESAAEEGSQDVMLHFANGQERIANRDRYKSSVFRYFCGIIFGVNMSAGFFMTSFQPVLVNVFNTSDAKLGLIFEIIAVFAILPPLMVAILSRHLMDRQIMVIGLGSKLIGMALFLPLFGAVREWQVIVGFLLIIKASIFFSTASMSLFTKLLGPMSTSAMLGLLASGSNVGPAVAQIVLADHIVKLFGSFRFGLFAIPAIISLFFILHPKRWRRLNPNREFTQLLLHVHSELSTPTTTPRVGNRGLWAAPVVEKEAETLAPETMPMEQDDEVAPREEEVAPREEEVAPREEEVAPREEEVAPREEEVAPREEEVAPREEEVTPTVDEVAPMEAETVAATPGVVIVAAMISPKGKDRGQETVTLRNKGGHDVALVGWRLQDRRGETEPLSGTIVAGSDLVVKISGNGARLYNRGDDIVLVDENEVVVDSVSYTKAQVKVGKTLEFV